MMTRFHLPLAPCAIVLLAGCPYEYPGDIGPDSADTTDADATDAMGNTDAAPCVARFTFEAGDDAWVASVDGTGLRNVSLSTHVDAAPQWSPAGDRIAFESSRTGNRDIFTVKPDGTDLANLTSGTAATDQRPVWSRDGAALAFLRDSKLWVMDAGGSNPRQLSTLDVYISGGVSWSPDGTRIAFASGDDIYTVPFVGGQPVNLTNSAAIDALPAWSPDGNKIAYTVQGGPGDDIWTMNGDGSGKVNLTMTPQALESGASWSPDSLRVVFTSDRDAVGGEVYVIAVASPGAHQRLTVTTGGEASPSWSPAGDRIAYVDVGTASTTVTVVAPNGSDPVSLSVSNASMVQPSWAPRCQ